MGSYKLRVNTARKVDSGYGRNRDASPPSLKEPSWSTAAVRGGRSYKKVAANYKLDEVDKLTVGKEAGKHKIKRILQAEALKGIDGLRFIAHDITFQNTARPQAGQAVALRSGSDLSVFYRCAFYGYQKTHSLSTLKGNSIENATFLAQLTLFLIMRLLSFKNVSFMSGGPYRAK
ncbi:hypothetical protein Ancab_010267 [Ancistrocladus abbreviatus]